MTNLSEKETRNRSQIYQQHVEYVHLLHFNPMPWEDFKILWIKKRKATLALVGRLVDANVDPAYESYGIDQVLDDANEIVCKENNMSLQQADDIVYCELKWTRD